MDRRAALKAPPKVVDTIFAWACEEIAAKLLPIVTKRYEFNLEQSKIKKLDKHSRKQFEDKAEVAAKLLAEVKKHAREASPIPMKFFPLDLSGWPYPKPTPVPTEVAAVLLFGDSPIRFGAAQFMEADLDRPGIGTISIYASDRGMQDIWIPSDLRKAFARIETSIEHEAQHLSQALLRRATGNESAGHPSAKPHADEPYDVFKEPGKYHRDPREFWPLLDSVAREMRLKLDGVPEAARPAELRRLIEKEPMLQSLSKKPTLWAKAVRELAKKIGPEGLSIRVATRFIDGR